MRRCEAPGCDKPADGYSRFCRDHGYASAMGKVLDEAAPKPWSDPDSDPVGDILEAAADRGRRVQVEDMTCQVCNGMGSVDRPDGSHMETCGACGGSGVFNPVTKKDDDDEQPPF